MGDERKKERSKKEIKGGASYTKQNQEMLEPKKIRKRKGKEEGKYWSQKKLENRGVRGDQTKKCLRQKKSRREKGGKKPRKALEPKREETGRERSLDDAFVPSFNVILSFWFGW